MSQLVISLLMQLAMVVPVLLGNVLLFQSIPRLAEGYERHHTHDQLEMSVALKCTFFQVITQPLVLLPRCSVPIASIGTRPNTFHASPSRPYAHNQVINTVFSSAVFFFDGHTPNNTRQWSAMSQTALRNVSNSLVALRSSAESALPYRYSLGGALVVNIMFGDFIFIQVRAQFAFPSRAIALYNSVSNSTAYWQ